MVAGFGDEAAAGTLDLRGQGPEDLQLARAQLDVEVVDACVQRRPRDGGRVLGGGSRGDDEVRAGQRRSQTCWVRGVGGARHGPVPWKSLIERLRQPLRALEAAPGDHDVRAGFPEEMACQRSPGRPVASEDEDRGHDGLIVSRAEGVPRALRENSLKGRR